MPSLSKMVLVILVLTGVSFGIFSFANDMLNNYGITAQENFTNTQVKLQKAFGNTSDLSSDVQTKLDEAGGFEDTGGVTTLSQSGLAGLKLPFQLVGIISALISDLGRVVGLPSWIGVVVVAGLLIALAFAVYSAVLRKDI